MDTVKLGPCGEKVGHYTVIPEERVSADMASSTWIRWLIRREDGAPTFAMRMFRVEPGGHIKGHSHPWEHEIFILDGVGEIRIGSRVYRVTAGFFLYIPPNVPHEYWNRGDKDLVFLCLIPHKPSVESDKPVEC
jgi:quercetin dioxygenase-like cupin family protein